ncbi:MAG: phage tail protein [Phormidium sp.]
MPKNGQGTYELNYVTANRFYVEIGGQIAASFSECSGLGVKIKKETHFEGGVNDYQRVILGQAEFSDVTLKRGITDSFPFWDWVANTLTDSQKKRRHVSILLFNQAGETMQCWILKAAIPIEWRAPALQANSTTIAIEELTLAYEGLEIAKSKGGSSQELSAGRHSSGYIL